jgi:hypothetical protein
MHVVNEAQAPWNPFSKNSFLKKIQIIIDVDNVVIYQCEKLKSNNLYMGYTK